MQAVASDLLLYPKEDAQFREYALMIVKNMAYVSIKDTIILIFLETVEAVSKYNNVPMDDVVDTLRKMLNMEYLIQKEQKSDFQKQ